MKNMIQRGLFVLVSVVAAPCMASDLKECMTDKMEQADDSMTIGQLRLECQKQLRDGSYQVEEDKALPVASRRYRVEKDHVLEPFTIMAHQPNYILAGAHNTVGYAPDLYREQYDNPDITTDKTEAQFQISIKMPLLVNIHDKVDIYAAYTNRSFWQVYNDEFSSPFRETNHAPEVWAQFNTDWEIFGFTNRSNSIGVIHQSNGQGGVLSRSWNRLYANFLFERGNFAFELTPWYRFSEDNESSDDNPDITSYLGHYEFRGAYKWNEHVFSVMTRNNLESGFHKGAVEVGWSFPLWGYKYVKGYVQYFTGYGESLIDYDQYVNRIGIGLALTDWL